MLERSYAGRETIAALAKQFRTTPNAMYLRLRRIRRDLLDCVQAGLDKDDLADKEELP